MPPLAGMRVTATIGLHGQCPKGASTWTQLSGRLPTDNIDVGVVLKLFFRIFLIFFLIGRSASAGNPVVPHEYELNVDLADYCHDEALKEDTAKTREACTPTDQGGILAVQNFAKPFGAKSQTCGLIGEMGDSQVKPYLITQKDTDGNTWKISFSFGNTRTHYFNSDVHLKDSRIDVHIKDAEFTERTSDSFYNPTTWKTLNNASQWIDEPTNTFLFSAQKGANVIYLSIFHPKFLINNQDKQVTGIVDGVPVNQVMQINPAFHGYNNQPGEMHLTRFQDTHMQMDWEIGYGRKFIIFSGKKAGTLSYTPAAYIGLTSGKNDSLYLKKGAYWDYDEIEAKNTIEGANISVSQRLEYQRGRVSLFVDQKFTHSELKHQFMDGEADFSMNYMPVSFGLGLQLFKLKSKAPDGTSDRN